MKAIGLSQHFQEDNEPAANEEGQTKRASHHDSRAIYDSGSLMLVLDSQRQVSPLLLTQTLNLEDQNHF